MSVNGTMYSIICTCVYLHVCLLARAGAQIQILHGLGMGSVGTAASQAGSLLEANGSFTCSTSEQLGEKMSVPSVGVLAGVS